MNEQQYNELLEAFSKEVLAKMFKANIRNRFPEPIASMYCQQFDNFKSAADSLEFVAKIEKLRKFIRGTGCFDHVKFYKGEMSKIGYKIDFVSL